MTAIVHLWRDGHPISAVERHGLGAEVRLMMQNGPTGETVVIYTMEPAVTEKLAVALEKAAEQLRRSAVKESVAFEKAR